MYALTMTIDHYYWKWDHEHYCARQAEKEALESYFQKQGNTFTSSTAMASQNKANLSPVALFTKNSFSKSSLCSTLKKQSNTLQIDLSSKLASNDKLTSNKHKKHLKNNLCLYCSVSSLQTVDLVPLYFIFHFHFHLILFSYFSIFRTVRVRVRSDWSHCHISHNLMVWSQHWSWNMREQNRRL